MSEAIIMPIILAFVTAFVTAIVTYFTQRKKFQNELNLQQEQFQNELNLQQEQFQNELKRDKERFQRDFELDREKVRTEFMAEQVVKQLLESKDWKHDFEDGNKIVQKRSFKEIKGKLGGFEDDELQKILVRAGAVKFRRRKDGEELWGLISRNKEDLK